VTQTGEVAFEARLQVVEHAHVRVAAKVFDDMAADETRAAGDQYFHGGLTSCRLTRDLYFHAG
jgi:hypothetical protein